MQDGIIGKGGRIHNVNTNSGPGCCQGSSGVASGGTGLAGYLPSWLRGRRVLMLGAVALAGGGAALGWPWLVAFGVAPILLALLPCAAMCALGLCMGKHGSSASADAAGAKLTTIAPALLDDAPRGAPFPPVAHARERATLS